MEEMQKLKLRTAFSLVATLGGAGLMLYAASKPQLNFTTFIPGALFFVATIQHSINSTVYLWRATHSIENNSAENPETPQI